MALLDKHTLQNTCFSVAVCSCHSIPASRVRVWEKLMVWFSRASGCLVKCVHILWWWHVFCWCHCGYVYSSAAQVVVLFTFIVGLLGWWQPLCFQSYNLISCYSWFWLPLKIMWNLKKEKFFSFFLYFKALEALHLAEWTKEYWNRIEYIFFFFYI